MSNGVGTSKEDKKRKRRSLPYEKKPQADAAIQKKKIEKLLKEFFNKHAKELKEPAKFWRILKKRPGKQSVLLTKRKKPRQEPLDMKHGGKAKKMKVYSKGGKAK